MAARMVDCVRDKLNSDLQHERDQRALKKQRVMVAVPFEWHTAQTLLAVKFPTYGWVPKSAIRWRTPNGYEVGWSSGRHSDQLMIDQHFCKA